MSGHVDDDLRTAIRAAFDDPMEVPELAAHVATRYRRRRVRRTAMAVGAAAVLLCMAVAARGLLTASSPTGSAGLGAPDVSRLPLAPSVLAWGYQGSATEDLDPTLLVRAEALWRATSPGKGARGAAELATLFAAPPGSPDAAGVSLLQFRTAGGVPWVGFAVESAGKLSLQGLQPVPAKGVALVATVLHLPTGNQFVVVGGPDVAAGSVTESGAEVRLTAEGGGVLSASAPVGPSRLTLTDSSGAVLYAGAVTP